MNYIVFLNKMKDILLKLRKATNFEILVLYIIFMTNTIIEPTI